MNERLDLNLMQVFDVLMRERSVSRAARRLGIGQPATSAALARLRVLFADPLFVRVPRGMEPTARAEAIAAATVPALAQIRAAMAPPAFVAATARRTFRVSGVDYLGLIALPALVARLRAEAPDIDLRIRLLEKDGLLAALETGDLDLAVAVLPTPPKLFAVERLLDERFVCVTRRGHPAAGRRMTLARYAACDHVLVTQRGDERGAVDDALQARGLARRVAVTVPQVAFVPLLLVGTDLVATIGRRAAERLAGLHGLAVQPVPIDLPNWHMDMVWSRRNDADPGLAWLRHCFRDATSGLAMPGESAD